MISRRPRIALCAFLLAVTVALGGALYVQSVQHPSVVDATGGAVSDPTGKPAPEQLADGTTIIIVSDPFRGPAPEQLTDGGGTASDPTGPTGTNSALLTRPVDGQIAEECRSGYTSSSGRSCDPEGLADGNPAVSDPVKGMLADGGGSVSDPLG